MIIAIGLLGAACIVASCIAIHLHEELDDERASLAIVKSRERDALSKYYALRQKVADLNDFAYFTQEKDA
jgi:hypothetical protein